ncbi:MAG: hypothetical protein AAFO70_06980, partial [Pseudomonadota bacterium]
SMRNEEKPSKKQTAVYIASLCEELKTLAQDIDADGLEYILGMAIYEAQRVSDGKMSGTQVSVPDIQRLYMSGVLEE